MSQSTEYGKLIIVPTPLGNLGDMTARALDALRTADVVCAEDTRVTGKLLAAFGIQKRLERLDEALSAQRSDSIAQRVLDGEAIAYCSDAGMPGVSDPGMQLVRACRAVGAPVEVLPGPTAVSLAYVASGCANKQFFFGGFFPRKAGDQRRLLESLRALDAALIFYESPNRLVAALRAIAETFPMRTATVCRELTKLHEEIARDAAPRLLEEFEHRQREGAVKGEIVLVIDGPTQEERSKQTADRELSAQGRAVELASQEMSAKQISKALVQEFGIPRNAAYDIALSATRPDSLGGDR